MELKKGYKQTEIGTIPDDWNLYSIDSLVSNIIDYRGVTPKKKGMDWGGGNIVALSAGNVKKGYIDYNAECYYGSLALYKKWMTNGDAKKDDIVFTLEAPLGNVALIPDNKKYILSQRTILLQLKNSFSSRFVFQQLISDKFQNYILSNSTGSTATGIKRKTFEKLYIISPKSFIEQQAIATVLSDTDQFIQNLKTLIAKKKAIKQGVMQELLTGKKRLQGFTGKWVTKKLGEIAEITGAGIDKKVNENEIPVILLNYMDVMKRDYLYKAQFNHQVTAPSKKIDGCDVQKGDIFITPSSELRTDIGISALAMEDMSGIVYSYHINRIRYKVEFNELFGLFMLKTRRFLDQAETLCEGSGKRYVISLSKFRNIDVIYPKNIKEQQAITQILSEIDAEIEVLEQQLQKTQALKQGMMQELLTGKIRLVKSAIQEKTEPLAMVAEQEVVYKKEIKYKKV